MNIALHVEHRIANQKPTNRIRLNLYAKRREIYLSHLGEGRKVTFPLVPTSDEIPRHVV